VQVLADKRWVWSGPGFIIELWWKSKIGPWKRYGKIANGEKGDSGNGPCFTWTCMTSMDGHTVTRLIFSREECLALRFLSRVSNWVLTMREICSRRLFG